MGEINRFGEQAIVDLIEKLESGDDDLVSCMFVLVSPRREEQDVESRLRELALRSRLYIVMLSYRPSRWSRSVHTSVMTDGRISEHIEFFRLLCEETR